MYYNLCVYYDIRKKKKRLNTVIALDPFHRTAEVHSNPLYFDCETSLSIANSSTIEVAQQLETTLKKTKDM